MRPKVLIAARQRLIREGLLGMLRLDSRIYVVGESSDESSTRALSADLNPDALVIYLCMPWPECVDVIRNIVREPKLRRVVAIAETSDADVISALYQAGAFGLLHRTSSGKDLVDAILTVMRSSHYIPPNLSPALMERLRRFKSNPNGRAFESLSRRELEVLRLLANGLTSRAIAEVLGISIKTAETHRSHIMSKLDFGSIAELTRYALRYGLTALE